MASQRANAARLAELLDASVAAARVAADYIRSRTGDRAALDVREKQPSDFVSEVDTGAESRIREVLDRMVPGALVVGEELSPTASMTGDTVFVVDPLDGTTNFLHGFPAYAVSIGAMMAGEVVAGVVLDIPHGELFTATAGGGAFRDGQAMHVSPVRTPSRALVGTGFPFKNLEFLADYVQQFERITRARSGVRRAGSAALDLASVACGRFDAFWELRLAPWDIAAGLLLVREAGGRVTDLEGRDIMPATGPVVATNEHLHEWLLDCLRA
ncbi:MAG TPA: inositol monophosphatase family protein [Gemmatimonadaceae bacterium]